MELHNHNSEQQFIQQQLARLQALKTEVIQAGTNRAHYERREQEIYAELAKYGITANNIEEAKQKLQAEKERIVAEIRALLPEGV